MKQLADTDGSGIVSSTELSDLEMISQQKLWLNRLMNSKNFFAGMLAGSFLCEIIILISISTVDSMLNNPVASCFNWITGIQQFIANVLIIITFTLGLIFSKKADDFSKNKNDMRLEFSHLAQICYVASFLTFVSWIFLHLLPYYTNKL